MTEPVDVGVLLPTALALWQPDDPSALLQFAVRAEQLGYASLWVNDSLLTPRIEALTMLAAIAPLTRRVTLGTAALLPVLRRPIAAAQTLASIDRLSGGRLVVAVGAGFPGRFGEPLHAWSGVPWEGRFTRLDETVALWRQLWTSPDARGSFHGSVLDFDVLPPGLPPARAGGPAVWLGGAADSALRRTGRLYDGWLPYPTTAADYAHGLAAVRAAATAAHRDTNAITAALFVSVVLTDTVEQGRTRLADFARNSYGMSLQELEQIQALAAGPVDAVVQKLSGYVAAGARHLVVRIAADTLAEQRDQLERLVPIANLLAGSA